MLEFDVEEVFLLGIEGLTEISALVTEVYETKVPYDILEYGEFPNGSCIEIDLRKITEKLSDWANSERNRFLKEEEQDNYGVFLEAFMIGLCEEELIPKGKYVFHLWW